VVRHGWLALTITKTLATVNSHQNGNCWFRGQDTGRLCALRETIGRVLPQVAGRDQRRGTAPRQRRLLYRTNEKHVSASTFTIALCGLKFFYEQTLQRTWTTLDLARPAREQKLPVVLSRAEVHQILSRLHRLRYRVCLTTIYSCGLRLREGVHLQVGDIDSARQRVHVRQGKGGQDRYVPLPEGTLGLLRQYWSTHRHPRWLFPAPTRAGVPVVAATQPIDES